MSAGWTLGLVIVLAACGGHSPQPTGPVASSPTFKCGNEQCPDSNFCLEYNSAGQMVSMCRPTPDGCTAPASCECIAQQGWNVGMCMDDGGTHSIAIFASPP